MSMSDDWQRLDQLQATTGGQQYGQYLQITPQPGNPDTVLASKDLILWQGKTIDLNAWRIYLAPWQPAPGIVFPPEVASASYANPTPWAPPEPRNFDAMADIPLYARIMWGSGGVQNIAYVDWPRRGKLIQVSGSFIRVNAFADTLSAGIDPRALPLVQATLAPEPGGGDTVIPGTFAYPRLAGQIEPGPPPYVYQNFQIPPFARAFIPLLNWQTVIGSSQIRVATMPLPLDISAFATNTQQVWMTANPATTADQGLFLQALPIGGQSTGIVRIESTRLGVDLGCMFLLDL